MLKTQEFLVTKNNFFFYKLINKVNKNHREISQFYQFYLLNK